MHASVHSNSSMIRVCWICESGKREAKPKCVYMAFLPEIQQILCWNILHTVDSILKNVFPHIRRLLSCSECLISCNKCDSHSCGILTITNTRSNGRKKKNSERKQWDVCMCASVEDIYTHRFAYERKKKEKKLYTNGIDPIHRHRRPEKIRKWCIHWH